MSVASRPRADPADPPEVTSPEHVTDPAILDRIPRSVECAAWEPEHGLYRAICLDFSLVAESRSGMLDAQQKLLNQIHDYVMDLIQEGAPAHLTNRRFTRRERFELELGIAASRFRSCVAKIFARSDLARDRAEWHQSLAFCR